MRNSVTANGSILQAYGDVYTPEVLAALSSLSHFNNEIKQAMSARIERRADRQKQKKRIAFLEPDNFIPRTKIKVQDSKCGLCVAFRRRWMDV